MSQPAENASPTEHRIELSEDPAGCLRLVSRAAEDWGARWQVEGGDGGRLELPVVAGVHRGWLVGRVTVEGLAEGSRLTFRVEESIYGVQTTTVTVLVLAACGALATVVAPFVPSLLPLVPLGIMLSVGAWFFVIARLRNSGPEEFLEALAMEEQRVRAEQS
ncbi:MAG: hypothetical protein GY856_28655 [bacterium]|nr:hypothetical protein [bacterium]